ncbi:MAG: DUF896 domain-containing protein [Lachnospiraceae bacterium]|nr:DUF896 domain-containing protein [Lachnospiraceae bacterium]
MDLNLDRINELARKQRTEGLTEEEIKEQVQLRAQYVAAIRRNLRSQLENIDILEPDGTITKLSEKKVKREEE